jgi:hypothetical protein
LVLLLLLALLLPVLLLLLLLDNSHLVCSCSVVWSCSWQPDCRMVHMLQHAAAGSEPCSMRFCRCHCQCLTVLQQA